MEGRFQQKFLNQKARSLALRTEKIKKRKHRLKALKSWILRNKERIYQSIQTDLNKSKAETDIFEIFPVASELNQAISNLSAWSSAKSLDPSLVYLGTSAAVLPEPKGTCLIIAPWNFPFQLVAAPLVSCLAAGNTAFIKPSEHTPATSALIQEMVNECFSPDIVTVVEGAIKETQELLALPFDHIFFTGSTLVGKIIMEAAAKNLTSVTLELGGKSPTIIDQSADLKDAARKISWGKFVNCGQTCIAPNHVFVHESVAEKFVNELSRVVNTQFGQGKAKFDSTDEYPRMVHKKHTVKMKSLLDEAVQLGAKIIAGGQYNKKDRFLAPTILIGVDRRAKVWQEEIFGPILPVNTFSEITEVIEEINSSPKPLAIYLFTQSASSKRRFATETSSGSLVVNDVVQQFSHPNLPFGGVGESGFGKSHGYAGFLAFSNEKSMLKQRIGLTNARIFFPPYSGMTRIVAGFLSKYF